MTPTSMPAWSALPFFEASHRDAFDQLTDFSAQHIAPRAVRDEQDTLCVAREYVASLHRDGWLRRIRPADIRTACIIRESLAHASSLADCMFAMQGLGGLPIALFGDAAQQSWFERITQGAIAAFALTEPEAGSDPAGMQMQAVREGQADDPTCVYRLTGEKTFISNAGLAEVYVIIARTAEGGDNAHTAFLMDGRSAGLSVEPLDVIAPHPIGTLRLQRVAIPVSQRLGPEGDGLRVALGTLDHFRASVAAAACGMARRALDEALCHTQQRRQFGKPLSAFQAVQFMLADMATELAAAQLLTARAAAQVDHAYAAGQSNQSQVKQAVSMAKRFATDHAHAIIDRAVQLFGGRGLVRGHPVERLYREVRALRIYEGASEIQRLVIARTLLSKK